MKVRVKTFDQIMKSPYSFIAQNERGNNIHFKNSFVVITSHMNLYLGTEIEVEKKWSSEGHMEWFYRGEGWSWPKEALIFSIETNRNKANKE